MHFNETACISVAGTQVAAARETMHLSWPVKCVTAWAVLAAVVSAVAVPSGVGAQQKCVPPGPGLSLNDFLSGKFYLFERQQAFSIKLLQTAVAASPKQNLIFSPHSIYTALLIAYFLSSNRTEENLRSFLNLPPEQVPLCERYSFGISSIWPVAYLGWGEQEEQYFFGGNNF